MKLFEVDIDCPHCHKSIHFEDANDEITNEDLKCHHCSEPIEMDSCDDDEAGLYFWLTKR